MALGDIRAVRPLVDRYGPLVWSLLCRHLGDDSARHVSFQVFRELFDNAASLVRDDLPEVVTVAAVTRRQLAATGLRASRETQMKPGKPSVADCVRKAPELVAVSRSMISLPNDQKRVIELAVMQGLSVDAIAEQTGMPKSAVRRSLRQGLQVLRGELSSSQERTSAKEGAAS